MLASPKMKYLNTNPTKYAQDLNEESHQTLVNKIQ